MIQNNKQKINFHNKKNKKNLEGVTILNTQSSKRGATPIRAEPAAAHDSRTPSDALRTPTKLVNILYILHRFILYKPAKRVTFCQFFAIVSRLNKLAVNKLYQFRLTFYQRFQLLNFNI